LAGVQLIVVFGFCFGGWDASEAVQEALLVVPADVVGGDELDVGEVAQLGTHVGDPIRVVLAYQPLIGSANFFLAGPARNIEHRSHQLPPIAVLAVNPSETPAQAATEFLASACAGHLRRAAAQLLAVAEGDVGRKQNKDERRQERHRAGQFRTF